MSKKKGIIYRSDGPALEYSPWWCNLYRGCSHGCTYCYLKRGFLKKSLGGILRFWKRRQDVHRLKHSRTSERNWTLIVSLSSLMVAFSSLLLLIPCYTRRLTSRFNVHLMRCLMACLCKYSRRLLGGLRITCFWAISLSIAICFVLASRWQAMIQSVKAEEYI